MLDSNQSQQTESKPIYHEQYHASTGWFKLGESSLADTRWLVHVIKIDILDF